MSPVRGRASTHGRLADETFEARSAAPLARAKTLSRSSRQSQTALRLQQHSVRCRFVPDQLVNHIGGQTMRIKNCPHKSKAVAFGFVAQQRAYPAKQTDHGNEPASIRGQ